jgi:hypothetical protein
VGKHLAREEPPPPKDKPRWRFLVAISGILVLAFIAMALVAALFPQHGPQAVAGPETTQPPFPPIQGGPDQNPTSTGPPATSTPPSRGATGTGRPSTTRAPKPPAGQLSGAYSVLPNAVWDTGFQAQVVIANKTGSAQSWQVRIVYPSTVTRYVTSWIDGHPEPHADVSGQTVIFSGSATVPAGATWALKFQFDKQSGGDFNPVECTVNGRACSVS